MCNKASLTYLSSGRNCTSASIVGGAASWLISQHVQLAPQFNLCGELNLCESLEAEKHPSYYEGTRVNNTWKHKFISTHIGYMFGFCGCPVQYSPNYPRSTLRISGALHTLDHTQFVQFVI